MAPTVLLLHGFTNTGASWDPVVAALGERYRALAPDIRGHGSASASRPVTLDAVIADVAAAAPERFVLAGYSQGGRIALHVALALPERVERLILVGASPGIADPAERAARRGADEALAAEIERGTIEEFAARWAATPVLADQPADVRAAAHADRLRNTPAGLAAALRGLGTGALPSLWDRLGELSMPVSLIVGERDGKFRALGAEMADALPRAEAVAVAGSGHAVHLEAPERVAEEIAGWGGG
ncbi:MAG TPA: 2-succinyl-6-hydroxy-2,4-cyclohexadiene-1-carboxylate synthase [Solirubrobacteraceae bacterium]|jgi:2-succinyl-6-hydroxy-2,4-cyclohexadiene-1-carboxylate synthase|nr:2-succinyl-6-hydroxy-2,4-cyclohexadiene-1-carboxylate synthase [Solirubrobacteraceae bacterium]